MRLDDGQIERYSRQIVLPEIGAEGQCRLLEARVAVVGTAAAAGDVVAQLAAAGVGTIAAPRAVHAGIDPARQTQLTPLETSLEAGPRAERCDVVALIGTGSSAIVAATHTLWLADGRIGETPPCATCVARTLSPAPSCDPELDGARHTVLSALLATEILKRLVGVGTPLAGRTLTYDPATATVTVESIAPDPACTGCAPRRQED